MMIKSGGENAYFAASNSASGFFSYYDEIFGNARIGRIYAVKGGPGTGKSRFLRDVSIAASRAGWGTEYVYCSSDPYSLDAVILSAKGREGIAVLDATSPHVYEPRLPGAREELVNLGAFWDAEQLITRREEIEALNRSKGEAYRRAYRYLAGLGEMNAERDSIVRPFVRMERMRALAVRILQDVGEGDGFEAMPALMHSIGMRGEVSFDTYFSNAEKIFLIEDCRGSARYLMAELGELAREKRLRVRISHDPIEPEKLDGLFFCERGVAIAVCDDSLCSYPHRKIRMRSLVNTSAMRGVKRELNYSERMRRAMRHGALDSLERVKEIHFRLEEIYMSAMDFEAKENFTKKFCQSLFDLQTE